MNKYNGSSFETLLQEQLKDPKFKKEWDELEAERAIVKAIAIARDELNMTQAELAKKASISQSTISKIECGERVPTLKMLQKIAKSLGKSLKIDFI